MKTFDHIYSHEAGTFQTFQLASGYISTTGILFEADKVAAIIEAKGSVVFYDLEEHALASFDIPSQTGGREVYETVDCGKENGHIVLRFPIVHWIDNYPNCDGEHDRWDSVIVGYRTLIFDAEKQSVLFETT